MKIYLTYMALWACFAFGSLQAQSFGDPFTEEGVLSMEELIKKVEGKKKLDCKVTGTVVSVCQKKGCWIELMRPDEGSMRVTFKDYAIFMPKDISGRTIVLDGYAFTKETPVETLRHYAEDAGMSKEEIAKIKKGKKELAFEAKGVIVK